MNREAEVFASDHRHFNEELGLDEYGTIEAGLMQSACTKGHSDRVAGNALVLAEAVGDSEEQFKKLHLTGILHDVGKIGVPDYVLNKPGRLTDEEFDMIKQHPTIGHKILLSVKSLSYVLDADLHHHENFDGIGYPDGLAGTDIALASWPSPTRLTR